MTGWAPHVTVACVIARDDSYLLVEERDKHTGELVLNQPAGHLEFGESLLQAARRETLEETGWRVEPVGLIGVALYTPPGGAITYCRHTFIARPVERVEGAILDPDIRAVHWLDYRSIRDNSARMRSPLVLASIERHRGGICYPLELIYTA